jgi:DNA-binding IclR family transcriptional regulator
VAARKLTRAERRQHRERQILAAMPGTVAELAERTEMPHDLAHRTALTLTTRGLAHEYGDDGPRQFRRA